MLLVYTTHLPMGQPRRGKTPRACKVLTWPRTRHPAPWLNIRRTLHTIAVQRIFPTWLKISHRRRRYWKQVKFIIFTILVTVASSIIFQKLEYSAYSSSLYGNDRVPLQYSGYYPMHGYHATPASFNIGNLNFAGNVPIDIFFLLPNSSSSNEFRGR